MATMTLENVPDDLYRRLQAAAARNRRSLDKEAIFSLERALAEETMSPAALLARVLQCDSDCFAYDCEFAALAEELDVPLVTSDARLLAAFPHRTASPESLAP